jgi:hypothetical protein
MGTQWEFHGNTLRTTKIIQHAHSPKKITWAPLDACYLTSLVARIFFLAYWYSFPFLDLNVWQEDEPWVYVRMFEILGKDEDKSIIFT